MRDMEVLVVSRASLRFPERCLGCDNLPQASWRLHKRSVAAPICRRCRRRLWVARVSLWVTYALVGCTVVDLFVVDGASPLEVPWVLWLVGALAVVGRAGGMPMARVARVQVTQATNEAVQLAISDPALAAELAARSGSADPYRGGAAAMQPRRLRAQGSLAWLVGGCAALMLLAGGQGRWGVAFVFGLLPLGFVIDVINKKTRGTLLDRPVSSLWRRPLYDPSEATIEVRNAPMD